VDHLSPIPASPSLAVTDAERERVEQAIRARRAPSTVDAYRRRWRRFVAWCDEREASPFPADAGLVAVYATSLADAGRAISTIEGALSAIRHHHVEAGATDPTSTAGVAAVRAGLRRELGVAPRQPSHPLTLDELHLLLSPMDPARSLRDCRDRALILLGFAGALRRSEVAFLHVGHLDFRRDGIVITIAKSKGDQEGRGQTVGIARGQHHSTDPVAAVRSWLDRTGRAAESEAPLFSPIAWSDARPLQRHLTGRSVCRTIQARGEVVGVSGLTGHSLRSGHATVAAEAGAATDRLARQMRHRSLESTKPYIRPAQILIDTTSSALGL